MYKTINGVRCEPLVPLKIDVPKSMFARPSDDNKEKGI